MRETTRGKVGATAGGAQICSETAQGETRSLIEDQKPCGRCEGHVSIFRDV